MPRRNPRQKPARPPLASWEEPPRLCFLHGVLDASGEPVKALVTGSARRSVTRALATYAALAATGHAIGGEA